MAFIAPGAVSGAPGRIAFTGTDAVLLASNSSATSYSVTLTSLNGGTLGIDGLGNFFGATSGTTLNFNGSLSLVNTVLAHLTDTVRSGTDVVHVVAIDNNGNTIVRDIGVQTAAPVAPPSVTPGLLPANQLFSFSDGTARVVGQGQATSLDVAGQLGNSGVLVLGGVQSQLSLAGNLDLSGNTSFLAALSPNAYSTASLTIGGALSVQTGSSTSFSGTLSANTINNAGGTIRGNGTLDATGSTSIINTGTIEAVADYTLGSQRLVVSDNLTGAGTLTIDAGATLVLNGTVNTQTVNFVANSATQLAQYPYSPSMLVLKDAAGFTASTINGFTFADRLVLENVTLSGTPTYAAGVLTVNQAGGLPPLIFSMPDPDGHLTGLSVQAVAPTPGAPVVISFVGSVAPGVFAPGASTAGATERCTARPAACACWCPTSSCRRRWPRASARVRRPTRSPSRPTSASSGSTASRPSVGGGTVTRVTIPNVATTTATTNATTLAQIEQYLQTLTYEARGTAADQITVTVTDTSARSGAATINVTNTNVSGAFEWQPTPGSTDFTDPANWSVGTTAPGGGNFALFNTGDHTATGNGAVGQLINVGTTTLTGNIVAQGIGGLALSVDGGGALTLTGGALLNAQQQAIVGRTGDGLLLVAGGMLAVGGASSAENFVIGQQSGSTGTVLNLEQISANGTVVVGGAGTGTLELLGVASSMSDSGADIGQSAGSRGSVIVNGGEWTNNGLLTVGDAGTGSLLINGMNRGITGQVTAYDAAIGNQAGGRGTVTLDGGELLVANTSRPPARWSWAMPASAPGAAERQRGRRRRRARPAGNNTGNLIVGAAGTGLVRIGAYSSLLVYGDAWSAAAKVALLAPAR